MHKEIQKETRQKDKKYTINEERQKETPQKDIKIYTKQRKIERGAPKRQKETHIRKIERDTHKKDRKDTQKKDRKRHA